MHESGAGLERDVLAADDADIALLERVLEQQVLKRGALGRADDGAFQAVAR